MCVCVWGGGGGGGGVTRLAGCGIRLEDNVLVTEEGRDVLNNSCPQSPQQLTALINNTMS